MLVAGTSVPVIPCYLSGSFAAMPAGIRFPRPARIVIRVGPPVRIASVRNDKSGWEQVVRTVEERVRSLRDDHDHAFTREREQA